MVTHDNFFYMFFLVFLGFTKKKLNQISSYLDLKHTLKIIIFCFLLSHQKNPITLCFNKNNDGIGFHFSIFPCFLKKLYIFLKIYIFFNETQSFYIFYKFIYFILFCMTKYNICIYNNKNNKNLGSEMKSKEKEGD